MKEHIEHIKQFLLPLIGIVSVEQQGSSSLYKVTCEINDKVYWFSYKILVAVEFGNKLVMTNHCYSVATNKHKGIIKKDFPVNNIEYQADVLQISNYI